MDKSKRKNEFMQKLKEKIGGMIAFIFMIAFLLFVGFTIFSVLYTNFYCQFINPDNCVEIDYGANGSIFYIK